MDIDNEGLKEEEEELENRLMELLLKNVGISFRTNRIDKAASKKKTVAADEHKVEEEQLKNRIVELLLRMNMEPYLYRKDDEDKLDEDQLKNRIVELVSKSIQAFGMIDEAIAKKKTAAADEDKLGEERLDYRIVELVLGRLAEPYNNGK